jgi:hypothetical protein
MVIFSMASLRFGLGLLPILDQQILLLPLVHQGLRRRANLRLLAGDHGDRATKLRLAGVVGKDFGLQILLRG